MLPTCQAFHGGRNDDTARIKPYSAVELTNFGSWRLQVSSLRLQIVGIPGRRVFVFSMRIGHAQSRNCTDRVQRTLLRATLSATQLETLKEPSSINTVHVV